jgi:hypothetical protein
MPEPVSFRTPRLFPAHTNSTATTRRVLLPDRGLLLWPMMLVLGLATTPVHAQGSQLPAPPTLMADSASTADSTSEASTLTARPSPVRFRQSPYRVRLGTENELLFEISVWGQVARPGQYAVPDGSTIIDVLSEAGGPTPDAKLKHVRILRDPVRGKSVELDLEGALAEGTASSLLLEPGDTVVVPAKRSFSLIRFGGVLSALALIANVVVLAAR